MHDPKAYWEPAQVYKIILAADTLQGKALIRCLWRLGCRVSELLNIAPSDILWQEKAVIIHRLKKRGGAVIRRTPVDADTLKLLEMYLKRYPQTERVFPMSRFQAYRIVRYAAEAAGIKSVGDPLISKNRRPHPHTLRHTYAVSMVKGGVPIEMVQKLLGHANLNTTMGYLQFSAKDMEDPYRQAWEKVEQG